MERYATPLHSISLGRYVTAVAWIPSTSPLTKKHHTPPRRVPKYQDKQTTRRKTLRIHFFTSWAGNLLPRAASHISALAAAAAAAAACCLLRAASDSEKREKKESLSCHTPPVPRDRIRKRRRGTGSNEVRYNAWQVLLHVLWSA